MRYLLLILFCLINQVIFSQTKNTTEPAFLSKIKPELVGMSSDRLLRIDTMCLEAINNKCIPGVVALVARKGKVVYYKAFGLADNQSNRTMEKNDIFRIGSMTKAITATAVMMLWEKGKFQLDDPVSRFIPEFKNMQILKDFDFKDTTYTTIPATKQITIRNLLTHTSGLGYGVIDDDKRFRMIFHKAGIIDAFTTDSILLGENIKKLAKLPLHFNPGEKYSYAEGLDVLGYLIEKLTGKRFDIFLRENLFLPLGMKDTDFYLDGKKARRLVPVQYLSGDRRWTLYSTTWYDPDFPIKGAKTYFSGGGGLSSTAYDYALFLQMYLNGGELNGIRFLSPTTIKTIMSNQIGNLWGENAENYYGLAFAVTSKDGIRKGGLGNIGSFGWGGYFNTQAFADPENQIIGILMKQMEQPINDETEWQFRIIVNQAVNE